jgi:hypothetical protein
MRHGGKSWSSISYNLLSGEVTGAALANGNLYISTYGEGVLELANFSLPNLHATLNGNVLADGATIYINGVETPVYGGHFTWFLHKTRSTADIQSG